MSEMMDVDLELNVDETETLLSYIQDKTGMIFAPRLHPTVRKQFDKVRKIHNAGNKDAFLKALVAGYRQREAQVLFESLSVHETMFFRDAKYFHFIETFMLPKIIENNRDHRSLTIWIAAGSSGQEIYSILFLIYEKFPELKTWKLNLYSTDLSGQIIDKASKGIYEIHELNRGLTEEQKMRYFKKVNDSWQIQEEYRSKVIFKVSNLKDNFEAHVPAADFISCRNVLIYFDSETKADIIKRFSQKISPKGFLLLGQVDYINSKPPSVNFEYKMEGGFPFYHSKI